MSDDLLDAVTEAFRPFAEAVKRIIDAVGAALRYAPPPPKKEAPNPQRKETPKMSKDYRFADDLGDVLSIKSASTNENTALVSAYAVLVPQKEAAVAALALLTASGVTPRGEGQPIEHAAHLLRTAIDEAALDAEALALFRAATGEDYDILPTTPIAAEFWRKAARKAREIHGK